MAEIVLHYDPSLALALAPFYRDLFAALPADIELWVLCPSSQAADDFVWQWGGLAREGERAVSVVSVSRPITIWARDRRIARCNPVTGEPAVGIVPSPEAFGDCPEQNEAVLPLLLHDAGLAPRALATTLPLEGGNVVSNGRHAFIGRGAMKNIADTIPEDPLFQQELYSLLGLPPVIVHDDNDGYPWFHIDMYVTPIDEWTVLVASPAFGHRLLAADDAQACSGQLADRLLGSADQPEADGDAFDAVASQLAACGYTVLRVPALASNSEEWMVTYNNVLMETRAGRRIVYMPIYHVDALDVAARTIYESLGFEVRGIDVSGIFSWGGAVRCLANVTRRTTGVPTRGAAAGDRPRRLHVIDLGPEGDACASGTSGLRSRSSGPDDPVPPSFSRSVLATGQSEDFAASRTDLRAQSSPSWTGQRE